MKNHLNLKTNFIFLIFFSVCLLFTGNSKILGQGWSPIGSGTNNDVYALTLFNNNLIVVGNFTTAGGPGANRIAQWDGTHWTTFGTGFNNRVNAVAIYNGNLVAAGNFTTAGGVSINRIAMWNGYSWIPLDTGIDNGQVNALAVYSNNLYAGGTFTTIRGNTMNRIAKWNGTTWSILTNGLDNAVNALLVYNGNLVVGGQFTTVGISYTNRIAAWNGTAWSAIGQGISNGQVYSLENYHNSLIAGGSFSTIGGVTYHSIAKWNGTNWYDLNGGTDGNVMALTVYLGDLYVGGTFQTAGAVNASRIAKWNDTSWSALGTGIDAGTQVNALTTYEGILTVGGKFTSAGGQSANNIAVWGSVPVAPTLSTPLDGSTGISLTPTLSWTAIPNAVSYRLQVSASSTFDTALVDVGGLTNPQYTVTTGFLNYGTTYYWRVCAVNELGNGLYSSIWHFTTLLFTGISKNSGNIPEHFKLYPAYPNPFNPSTTIKFDLPVNASVKIKIYNSLGEENAVLYSGNLSAGTFTYHWDAKNFPSGIYFCKIEAGENISVQKLLLVK
ncbi:MAG: T9SS type A sorting domain-containing protein [Ignavibacteria bacterium]|jgi:hypothetical protein